MRIVHICIAGQFSDDYSYQENLLTKYHARDGHKVSVITSDWALNDKGEMVQQGKKQYQNNEKVNIYRIKRIRGFFNNKIKIHEDYSALLKNLNPQVIFVHGSQFRDIHPIVKYKELKGNAVKIFVDNHADYSNSARNFFSREILHKLIWRYYTRKMIPVVEIFYGVMPSRANFLKEMYKVSEQKIRLLNMGGDDDYVNQLTEYEISKYKEEFSLPKDKKIIVTGGKIDDAKREVLQLMEYVSKKEDLHLIIFGPVTNEIKPLFDKLLTTNVVHLGWINNEESYKVFHVADLVVFPGRHSVYWEQVVSQQKPMVVKYWEGTTHIDIGGNVEFVKYSNKEPEKLFELLDRVFNDTKLDEMKLAAKSEKHKQFLYSHIAKKSIGGS